MFSWTTLTLISCLWGIFVPCSKITNDSSLLIGWGPLPFWPTRSLPIHVQTEKSSLTSGVGTLSLYFSRTQLLPLALSLECLGENKACILLCLIKIRCLAQGPIYLLPHSEGNDDRQSSLWPKSIMEKWIAISYFRARNKNSSETGLCSGSHLRKQLCTHFGEDPKTSQMWRKKPGNGPKVNEDPEGFTSLLCSSSLRTPALLSGCVSA